MTITLSKQEIGGLQPKLNRLWLSLAGYVQALENLLVWDSDGPFSRTAPDSTYGTLMQGVQDAFGKLQQAVANGQLQSTRERLMELIDELESRFGWACGTSSDMHSTETIDLILRLRDRAIAQIERFERSLPA